MTREEAKEKAPNLITWLKARSLTGSAQVVETLIRDDFPMADPVTEPIRQCPIPPAGWMCTRGIGHTGPCAAVPEKYQTNAEKRNRTKAEVHALRRGGPTSGCCNRFFDMSPCDCMEQAACDFCDGSGQDGVVQCAICKGMGR